MLNLIQNILDMEVTYENIKSLIVSLEEEGQMLKLKFQAEGQENPIETVAVIMPDQDELIKNAMQQAAMMGAANAGINMASSALGNAIGGIAGDAAKTAGQLAGSHATAGMMNTEKMMKTEVTDEKKQTAIVQAFTGLQMYYQWNGNAWKYVQPGA